jgi:anti-anti-sigma factor
MPVQHTYDSSNRTLQISISDHFNFDVHAEFREAYRNIPADGADKVVVDLRRTEYMDSSALGMLLLLDEHFTSVKIELINCSDYIKEVLEISNFDQKFTVA